ncbi:MAG: hypothetical protein AAGA10_12815 [Bacteroidota bacterium]
MRPFYYTAGLILSLFSYLVVPAQVPLFSSEEIITIKLIFDMERVTQDVGEDRKAHEAMLIETNPEGKEVSSRLEISVRGNFRRQSQTCGFPPLKLDFFRKKDPPKGVFEGQNKLKLVTHCEDGEHVLREYLVYKLYNLISPYSFKVRLARVTYQDARGILPLVEEYAFLIEDDKDLAKRIGGVDVRQDTVLPTEANRDALTTLYVFQCMIGNLDWDLGLVKNIKAIDMGEEIPPIIVPYDFDFSKLVNAPYTFPYVGGLERQVFRGICRSEEEVEKVWTYFQTQKKPVLDLYKKFDLLDPLYRKECIGTLKAFYKNIKNLDEVQANFSEFCL